jgi:prepilin-type processing-associated H-X9-DG protein
LFTLANISYSLGFDKDDLSRPSADESKPQTILAADRNHVPATGGKSIWTDPGAGTPNATWENTIHSSQGNVGLGDGSVQQANNQRLGQQIKSAGTDAGWPVTLTKPE